MKIYFYSFAMAFNLSFVATAQQQEARPTRAELKQSVSKMTYENGDRRMIKLDGKLEALRQGKGDKTKTKSPRPNSKIESYPEITVQCSPLGEAEAIGALPKKKKTYEPQALGAEIEIKVPPSLNIADKDWRRIAELACLEDEI